LQTQANALVLSYNEGGGKRYESNAVDPQLESARFRFEPSIRSSENPVSKFTFECQRVCRYGVADGRGASVVGLYKLNPVNP
jgi:hypothetical protein